MRTEDRSALDPGTATNESQEILQGIRSEFPDIPIVFLHLPQKEEVEQYAYMFKIESIVEQAVTCSLR